MLCSELLKSQCLQGRLNLFLYRVAIISGAKANIIIYMAHARNAVGSKPLNLTWIICTKWIIPSIVRIAEQKLYLGNKLFVHNWTFAKNSLTLWPFKRQMSLFLLWIRFGETELHTTCSPVDPLRMGAIRMSPNSQNNPQVTWLLSINSCLVMQNTVCL